MMFSGCLADEMQACLSLGGFPRRRIGLGCRSFMRLQYFVAVSFFLCDWLTLRLACRNGKRGKNIKLNTSNLGQVVYTTSASTTTAATATITATTTTTTTTTTDCGRGRVV